MPLRRIAPLLLAFLLTAAAPFLAHAQEEGYAFRFSNFSLELYGGLDSLDPTDLNRLTDYESSWLDFYFAQQFDYLHSLYGDDFTYSLSRPGGTVFEKLQRALALGGRIRYQFSPTFSLTLGFTALDGRQASDVAATYAIVDHSPALPAHPDSYSYDYRNPAFLMRIRGWGPELGAHFGWDLNPFLRSEIFIGFGPLFTEATAVTEKRIVYTTLDGYRSESVSRVEMTGSATGLSGELGTGVLIRLAGFLRLWAEGSYAFREPGQLRGPGSSLTTFVDTAGANISATSEWTGQWSLLTPNESTAWGRFSATTIQNRLGYDEIEGIKRFALDMSGFQLKAGLSLNF